jgi:hypothetical protein
VRYSLAKLKNFVVNREIYQTVQPKDLSVDSLISRFSFIPNKKLSELRRSHHGNSMKFRFKVQIHKPFKWYRLEGKFHSVFSGSNDRVLGHTPQIELIVDYINSVVEHENLVLISVVGGGYFLDLVDKLDPASLILFDSNILEFVKTAILIKNLDKTNPQEKTESEFSLLVDRMQDVTEDLKISFELYETSKWLHKEHELDSFPMLLNHDRYPEESLQNAGLNLKLIQERISKSLIDDVWLDLPRINVERKTAVVFLSNCTKEDISNYDVAIRIVNHSGLIIIRSGDTPGNMEINRQALDPHAYFLATLQPLLNLESIKTNALEIYPKELKPIFDLEFQVRKNNFDRHFVGESVILGEFNTSELSEYNVLVTHMLFGKVKNLENIGVRGKELEVLCTEICPNILRVIITEHNPESKQGKMLSNVFSDLESLITNFNGLLLDFNLTEVKFSPGFDEPKRNVFLVYDRVPRS